MKTNYKVTIIIPVYNAEKHLKMCLDSVINQTLKEIEIICIDDKSTDNSPEILKEYEHNDKRVKIIKNIENKGTGYSRNIGLKESLGEYIMLLDSDDWYEPQACEKAYTQINNNKDDIVFFNYTKNFEYNNTKEKINVVGELFDIYKNNSIKISKIDRKTRFLGSYHCMSIYDKKFLKLNNIEYTNTTSYEDTVFRIKALSFAENISVINENLYNYRIVSKKIKQRKIICMEETFNNIILGLNYILKSENKNYFLPTYIEKYGYRVAGEFKLTKICKTKDFKNKCFNLIKETLTTFNSYYNFENFSQTKKIYKIKAFLKAKNIFQYKIYCLLYKIHLIN